MTPSDAASLRLSRVLGWGALLAALTSCEFWILGPASWIYGYGGMLETIPFHLGLQHSGSTWSWWAPFVSGGVDRLAAWGNADPFNVEPLLLTTLPVWLANGLHAFLQRWFAFVFTALLARDVLKLPSRGSLLAGTAHLAFSYYTFGAMFTSPLLPAIIWGLHRAAESKRPILWAVGTGLLAAPGTSFVHGVPYLLVSATGWFLVVTPRHSLRFAGTFAAFTATFILCESPQFFALLLQAAESSRTQYPAESGVTFSLPGLFYLEPEFDLFNQDSGLKAFGIWVPLVASLLLVLLPDAERPVGRRIGSFYLLLALRFVWLVVRNIAALAVPFIMGIYMGRFASVAYPLLAGLIVTLAWLRFETFCRPVFLRRSAVGLATLAAALALIWPKVSLWRDLGVNSPGAGMLHHPQYQALRQAPEKPFRVASVLDLPPAYAYGNGLESVDGWANLYSGRYRQLWLRVLDPLFVALPANKEIFAPEGRKPQDVYIYLGTSLLNPGLGVLPGEDTAAALRDGFDVDRRFRLNLLSLLNVRYLLAEQPLRGTALALHEKPAARWDAICRDYATGKVNFPKRSWTRAGGGFDFATWWDDTRRGYQLKLQPPGVFIYENRDCLARFRSVTQLQVLPTSAQALDALVSLSAGELATTAVAAAGDAGVAGLPTSFAPTEVEIVTHTSDHWHLRVEGMGDRLLVTSLVHNRYWSAWVDDTPRPLVLLNHAMFGVALRAGESRVELRYTPPYAF